MSGGCIFFFFFQAEDGIRDYKVTGVQTCALPIYAIQTVEDGEEAVAYLSGKPPYADRDRYTLPALMLLDLKLPRKSGLEVLQWVRQQDGLKRLPVVVLTSSRETADVNRAYDLGANSYLVKPVAFEALLDVVKMLNLYWMILSERPEVGNHEQVL